MQRQRLAQSVSSATKVKIQDMRTSFCESVWKAEAANQMEYENYTASHPDQCRPMPEGSRSPFLSEKSSVYLKMYKKRGYTAKDVRIDAAQTMFFFQLLSEDGDVYQEADLRQLREEYKDYLSKQASKLTHMVTLKGMDRMQREMKSILGLGGDALSFEVENYQAEQPVASVPAAQMASFVAGFHRQLEYGRVIQQMYEDFPEMEVPNVSILPQDEPMEEEDETTQRYLDVALAPIRKLQSERGELEETCERLRQRTEIKQSLETLLDAHRSQTWPTHGTDRDQADYDLESNVEKLLHVKRRILRERQIFRERIRADEQVFSRKRSHADEEQAATAAYQDGLAKFMKTIASAVKPYVREEASVSHSLRCLQSRDIKLCAMVNGACNQLEDIMHKTQQGRAPPEAFQLTRELFNNITKLREHLSQYIKYLPRLQDFTAALVNQLQTNGCWNEPELSTIDRSSTSPFTPYDAARSQYVEPEQETSAAKAEWPSHSARGQHDTPMESSILDRHRLVAMEDVRYAQVEKAVTGDKELVTGSASRVCAVEVQPKRKRVPDNIRDTEAELFRILHQHSLSFVDFIREVHNGAQSFPNLPPEAQKQAIALAKVIAARQYG